jgi:hypothetical protein
MKTFRVINWKFDLIGVQCGTNPELSTILDDNPHKISNKT